MSAPTYTELTPAQIAKHLINRAFMDEIHARNEMNSASERVNSNAQSISDWNNNCDNWGINPFYDQQDKLNSHLSQTYREYKDCERIRKFIVEHFTQYVKE